MRSAISLSVLVIALLITSWDILPSVKNTDDAFLGRWDIDVHGSGSGSGRTRYCWLELKRENGNVLGRLQPGEGATVDITEIRVEGEMLSFRQVNQPKAIWKANVKGKKLEGTVSSPAYGNDTRKWTGVRAPMWPEKTPVRKPGKPIDLIGKDISGWNVQNPDRPIGWFVRDGILMNEGKQANNIFSKQKFRDFRLETEFRVDPKSNGGIYLRGRYEIQVMDGFGQPLNVHSQGALYGFIVPPVNACRPAGEWQTFDITIIANRLTVILNGIKLIDNAEIPGITGGALDSREDQPGPVLLQGDHGPVQFRKLVITPLS